MRLVAMFVSGLMFGLGIHLSGLFNPSKVRNFFNITGQWDPSLGITIACAVLVTWIGYRLVLRPKTPGGRESGDRDGRLGPTPSKKTTVRSDS